MILPTPPEQKAFVDTLKTAFKNARSGGQVDFIATADGASDITLVSLVNLFPLRFVRLVRGLKQAYEQRLREVGRARGVLEVHAEGDGSQLPELFIPDTAAIADRLRPVLLLAVALGLVTDAKSPTGAARLALQRKDADGFDLDPVVLGLDLQDAALSATESNYELLRTVLTARLAQGGAAPDTVRETVLSSIAVIRSARGSKVDDPVVAVWNGAGREAMKILRGEIEP